MEENILQPKEFVFAEKLALMAADKDKRMKIIALYWKFKGWQFQNELQYTKALRRELRASKELLGYNSQQITETMEFCEKEFEIWTLESCGKRIEDIALGGSTPF